MSSYKVDANGVRTQDPGIGAVIADILKPDEGIQGPMKYWELGLAFLVGNMLGNYSASNQIGIGLTPGLRFPK